MIRISSLSKLLCLCLLFCLIFVSAASAREKKLLRIGTGGRTGVYHPVGKLIAEGLTVPPEEAEGTACCEKGLSGYIGVAQTSAGSVENIRAVLSGGTEAGIAQADMALMAYQSEGPFAGSRKAGKLRAAAALYPEKLHIIVRRDSGIRRVTDLKGKRFSLDEQGSGTLPVVRRVLDAYGLDENEIDAVYLKPEFTEDKVIRGELQGFTMMAGTPAAAVLRLSGIGLNFLPVAKTAAEDIHRRHPYLVPGVIRAGVYKDIPATPTVQVHALLVVKAEMDKELVYKVVRTLWNSRTRSLLQQGHPEAEKITLDTALEGLSIPLHKGARRFYEAQGMLDEDTE